MRRLMFLVLAATLLMGACGGSSSDQASGDAEGTLIGALVKLQNGPSTVTLTLRSDPESLRALSAGDEDGLSATELNAILGSSVTVSHNGATNPRDARSETTVDIGSDGHAIETRTVDRTVYLRVDVEGLANTFGESDADLQRLTREAQASGLSFMKAALEGKWLALAGLEKLAARSDASVPMGSEQKEAVNAFAQKLLSEATVKTVGEDEAGTHLEVSVPARQGYAALRDAIAGLSPLPPEAPVPDPSAIPDKDIKVDAWVKDGTLTQMQIDFLQLSALGGHEVPAGVHSLALRMTFRDFAGTIEAPSVAVPVDIEQLAKMFAAQGMESSAMGSSSVGPATAIPDSVFPTMGCETLKTMSQEHIKSLLSGSPKEMKALARACPLLALQK